MSRLKSNTEIWLHSRFIQSGRRKLPQPWQSGKIKSNNIIILSGNYKLSFQNKTLIDFFLNIFPIQHFKVEYTGKFKSKLPHANKCSFYRPLFSRTSSGGCFRGLLLSFKMSIKYYDFPEHSAVISLQRCLIKRPWNFPQ